MDYTPAQLNGVELPRKMEVRDNDGQQWTEKVVIGMDEGEYLTESLSYPGTVVAWRQCREIQSFKEFDGVWPEGAEWYVVTSLGQLCFGKGDQPYRIHRSWNIRNGYFLDHSDPKMTGYDPAKYNDEPVVRPKTRIPRTAEFVSGMRGIRREGWELHSESRISRINQGAFRCDAGLLGYEELVKSDWRFIDFEGKEHLPYSEGFE